MNIYLIEQNENNGYDTYDSAVVAAENKEIAKRISPYNGSIISDFYENYRSLGDWCTDIKYVQCTLIGKADPMVKQGLILASYNPG